MTAPSPAGSAAPLERRWRVGIVGILVCAAVLAVTWWLLERAPNRLPAWEADVFTAINGWPDGLRFVLWPIMQLGNFWVWLVGSLVALAIWRRPAPALTVALATLLAWAGAKVVKDIVGRARPAAYFPDVHLRDGAVPGDGFVSGHAAVAFALATALAPWLRPRWLEVLAYALATIVAVARIFVGAHLPADVIGGAALGVACGLTARLAVGEPVDPPPA